MVDAVNCGTSVSGAIVGDEHVSFALQNVTRVLNCRMACLMLWLVRKQDVQQPNIVGLRLSCGQLLHSIAPYTDCVASLYYRKK